MIEIEYIEKEKFVYVKTTSNYSADDVKEFLLEATEFAKQFNCDKILLDHRNCRFEARIIHIHQITKYLNKYGFNLKTKGAVVYDQDNEKYRFADIVTQNWSHGILRFFDDYEVAKKWLIEK